MSCTLLAVLVSLAAAAAAAESDPRSTELLRLDCQSQIGRREITLFANGTVRLRQTAAGVDRLRLEELGPEERSAVLARLEAEDLSEVDRRIAGVEGEWVERCELALALGGPQDGSYSFRRLDSLPLGLWRVVRIAEQLGDRAESNDATRFLPAGYRPRTGDVLSRFDGVRFEVVGFTADGRGVELQGLDQPLTIYVDQEQLGTEFLSVESTAGR